jgi:type IV secretory pathway VirD2 relaxase
MLSTYKREDSLRTGNRTNYFTENNINDYIYSNSIIINSLDIADGLKELLIKYRYTLKELSSMSYSKLAESLGIDLYIAKIICATARKLSNCNYRI